MNLELASIYMRNLVEEVFKKLKNRKIKYIIINGYTKLKNSLRFSHDKIDLLKKNLTHEMVIALSNGKGIYLSRLKSLDIDVDKYVEELIINFERQKIDIPYSPPKAAGELYEIIVGAYDEKMLDMEYPINFIENLLNEAGDELKVSGSLHINAVKHILKTSYGSEGEYKLTNYLLNIRGFRNKDISNTVNRTGSSINSLSHKELIKELCSSINGIDYFNKIEEGTYNIIFSPLAFANILNYIGRMFSGSEIYSNISPFSRKIGCKVTDKKIQIYDNPREKDNPIASLFDEEGVLRNKVFFIKNGVVESYALNGLYAGLLKLKSTGHAGILYPLPKSLIFHMESQFSKREDLYEVLSDAILINNVWYTRFSNYREGIFSTLQRDIGMYIRNGKPTGSFKGARINLSIYDIFKNLEAASSDLIWVKPWDVNIPVKAGYVAVRDVKVTTGI